MYGDSNMETYITICQKENQWEFAVCLRELKWGSVATWKRGMGREVEGRFKREGVNVYLWLTHV